MAIYTIQVDGHKLRIQAPDEATALAEANAWKPEKVKPSGPVFNPGKDAMRAIQPVLDRGKVGIENLRQGKPVDPLDNPLLSGPLALIQAVTNQVTGPVSRAVGRSALPIYEPLPSPLSKSFGKPVKRLEGEARDLAFEDILNTALMGVRSVAPMRVGPLKPAPARVKASPAEKKVGAAIEKAIANDGMTPMDVIAKTEKGVPSFQAGGENLTSLAEVAAQSSGPARRVLRAAGREYAATAPNRTKAEIAQSLGGRGDYFDTLDASIEARAKAAQPSRERAFAAPIDPDAYGASIAPLLPRIPGKAFGYAMEIAKRDGVSANDLGIENIKVPGKPTMETVTEMVRERVPGGGFRDVPVQKQVRVEAPMEDAEFIISRPTMKTLHYVKKGIDQELESYRNAVTGKLEVGNGLGAATAKLRSEYGQALRKANPDYDEFMQIWGDESGHIGALQLGRDALSGKGDMSAELLARRVKDMNDVERDMYRKGVGEALIDKVRRTGDVSSMRALLKSDEIKDRVALAFPDDKSFASFMESAAKRVTEQDRNNQVFGGSPTYARQAARAELEADGGDFADLAVDVATFDAKSLGKKALKAGMKRKAPSILSDPKMNEMLGKAMSDPDQLTALLNLLQAARASSAYRVSVAQRAALPTVTTAAAQKEN